MKIILLAVLFMLPSCYGFHISKKTEKCFKNIRYLHMCLQKMRVQITQYLMPLGDIFYEFSQESPAPFCDIYKNIYTRTEKGGKPFKTIFLSEFEANREVLGFEAEEMQLIKNIGELMGSSNAAGQEKYLDGLIKLSQKILDEKEKIFKTKSAAYKKIGILAGLFLVIVFI